MATAAYEKQVLDLTLLAAEDLSSSQFYAVIQNSSGEAALADSGPGLKCIGLVQNDPASGEAARVRVAGVSKGILGGTVAYDDTLVADTNGKLIVAGSANGHVVGRALSSGAANEVIPVLLGGTGSAGTSTSVITLPVTLSAISDGDVITTWTPGFAGALVKASWVTQVPTTDADADVTLNFEIGTTNVTGGTLTLSDTGETAGTAETLGAVADFAAITAANTFDATDTISLEAASTTAYSDGAGYILLVVSH